MFMDSFGSDNVLSSIQAALAQGGPRFAPTRDEVVADTLRGLTRAAQAQQPRQGYAGQAVRAQRPQQGYARQAVQPGWAGQGVQAVPRQPGMNFRPTGSETQSQVGQPQQGAAKAPGMGANQLAAAMQALQGLARGSAPAVQATPAAPLDMAGIQQALAQWFASQGGRGPAQPGQVAQPGSARGNVLAQRRSRLGQVQQQLAR